MGAFLVQSEGFWVITALYWGAATYGWLKMALDRILTTRNFRETLAMAAVIYVVGICAVAVLVELAI